MSSSSSGRLVVSFPMVSVLTMVPVCCLRVSKLVGSKLMVFGLCGYIFVCVCVFFCLLLSWMFEHDCLDICCFGCLICMCFVFLYLHLFSAIELVSHGKVL